MKRTLILAVTLALAAALAWPAQAQDLASQLMGVWKQISSVEKDMATGTTTPFVREQQGGYRIFTRGGFTMMFNVYTPRKAPAGAVITDAERAELQKTMSVFSGTYKVDGNKVVVRVDASWIESWNGTDRTYSAEVSGTKLTMTVGPYKNPANGREITLVSTLERVE